jgi:hypothetical protein
MLELLRVLRVQVKITCDYMYLLLKGLMSQGIYMFPKVGLHLFDAYI